VSQGAVTLVSCIMKAIPASACISVNETGDPRDSRWSRILLKEGDIVSVDVGAHMGRVFTGDCAATYACGEISRVGKKAHCGHGSRAFSKAMKFARPGYRPDFGYRPCGSDVMPRRQRLLCGTRLRRSRCRTRNCTKRRRYRIMILRSVGRECFKGMVIGSEPMVNQGTYEVKRVWKTAGRR
jgi:methionine aminopeptidase